MIVVIDHEPSPFLILVTLCDLDLELNLALNMPSLDDSLNLVKMLPSVYYASTR